MNKRILIGTALAAAAGLGVYIARRMKGSNKSETEHHNKKRTRHLTNVFAKAKAEA